MVPAAAKTAYLLVLSTCSTHKPMDTNVKKANTRTLKELSGTGNDDDAWSNNIYFFQKMVGLGEGMVQYRCEKDFYLSCSKCVFYSSLVSIYLLNDTHILIALWQYMLLQIILCNCKKTSWINISIITAAFRWERHQENFALQLKVLAEVDHNQRPSKSHIH